VSDEAMIPGGPSDDEVRAWMARLGESDSDRDAETIACVALFYEDSEPRRILDTLTAQDFTDADLASIFSHIHGLGEVPADTLRVRMEMEGNGFGVRAGPRLGELLESGSARHSHAAATEVVRRLARTRREREAAKALLLAKTESDRASALIALRHADRPARNAVSPDAWEWDFAKVHAEEEPAPPDEFIERMIVRPSVNVMFGPPSSGKSWALLNSCLDAVHGGGCFADVEMLQIRPRVSKFGGDPESCLWVFGSEDTERRMRSRTRTSYRNGPHHDKDPAEGRFTFTTPPADLLLNHAAGQRWLEQKIARLRPSILVLDTVASLTGESLDVNKAEQVGPWLKWLHRLRDVYGLIVWIVHHTRKGGQDPKSAGGAKADAMLGAQTWRSLSDAVVMLDAIDGDTAKVTLRVVKAKDIDAPPPALHLTLDPESARFRELLEDEAAPERPRNRGGRAAKVTTAAVLALRSSHPDGIDWSAMPEKLGAGRSTWFRERGPIQDELSSLGHVVVGGILKWAP